jgi:dTDP-4-amino-4,6-dideoxygalactose transaminase
LLQINASNQDNYLGPSQVFLFPIAHFYPILTIRVTSRSKIPFFELRRQFQSPLREEILAELSEVCDTQSLILGSKVELLEQKLASVAGASYAVGASSGTDAQLLIMMAMGIGPGDAVVTTPFTFFATAGCISRLGARPLFVDIDPETFNLAPEALEAFFEEQTIGRGEERYTRDGLRVRAIVPVHLYGLCCDMDRLMAIAANYRVSIIEDAAQAIGAQYPSANGEIRSAGSFGVASFFSFYPTKNLGAFGDAGLAVTSDESLGKRLRIFRNHGMDPRYYHQHIGGNFRMDAIQAAVLLKKLPYLEGWSKRRWTIAQLYKEWLPESVKIPVEPYSAVLGERGHIYHQFVIRTAAADRDRLKAFLTNQGIGTEIYYPVALHRQECFADLGYRQGDFPNTEKAVEEGLALPIFPELTDDEVRSVATAIREYYHHV